MNPEDFKYSGWTVGTERAAVPASSEPAAEPAAEVTPATPASSDSAAAETENENGFWNNLPELLGTLFQMDDTRIDPITLTNHVKKLNSISKRMTINFAKMGEDAKKIWDTVSTLAKFI